jgi:hypothetical protein
VCDDEWWAQGGLKPALLQTSGLRSSRATLD